MPARNRDSFRRMPGSMNHVFPRCPFKDSYPQASKTVGIDRPRTLHERHRRRQSGPILRGNSEIHQTTRWVSVTSFFGAPVQHHVEVLTLWSHADSSYRDRPTLIPSHDYSVFAESKVTERRLAIPCFRNGNHLAFRINQSHLRGCGLAAGKGNRNAHCANIHTRIRLDFKTACNGCRQ
jgi:hypothetical protein